MQDLTFSRRRFKSRSSGLWRRVALRCDTDVSEEHSAFIFRAGGCFETSVSYRNRTRRHNPEGLDLNPLTWSLLSCIIMKTTAVCTSESLADTD